MLLSWYLCKAHVTRDNFAKNIAIKRYSNFDQPRQALSKTLIETHGPKLSNTEIPFYRNIECKKMCELGLMPALLYLKERLIAESADVLPLFVVNLSYVTGSSVKLRESSVTLVTRETPNFRRRRGTYDVSGHLKDYSKWPYINDVKESISSTFNMSLFVQNCLLQLFST